MVDWFYIGYCTVMAMFAVAFAYAAVFGFRALCRLPRSILLGFATAATVATLTAQKTNNVPPNMNQPQMQQGGGSFQTGFTRLTGFAGEGNLVNLVNPVQTTSGDIARGWRVESVTTNMDMKNRLFVDGRLVDDDTIREIREDLLKKQDFVFARQSVSGILARPVVDVLG